LQRGREIFENAAPCALVARAPAMALVDDDGVEEILRFSPKFGAGSLLASRPDMKVWKIVKNTLPFFGTRRRLVISSGLMRMNASSSKAANELKSLKA
jgi:Holliday junction resolvase